MKTRKSLILAAAAAAAALILPSFAFAQGQIDAGRANDASNRVGSGGRNGQGPAASYYSNNVTNNGNQIITGNVSMGREFHGRVGYTDPSAFRGTTAGDISDNFAKNSAGVPHNYTSEPVPNTSVPFYGASGTVAPPAGFTLNPSRTGYVPPPTTTGQRGLYDQRLGVVDLNQPIAPGLTPGDIMMRGSLNPQQAAQGVGILTGSPLYGVREWNPQDPADRMFLESLLNRQNTTFNRLQLDPDIRRMQKELEKALEPQLQQQQQGKQQPSDNVTGKPLGAGLEAPANPAITGQPVNGQLQNQPLGANGLNTEQGLRYNLMGAAARKTNPQYAELNKRLEQYYADRRKTDADYQREFNAQLQAKKAADAAAKAKAEKDKLAAGGGNDNTTQPKPPVTPDNTTPDKPKTKKPQPVKIKSLAKGVPGEGLSNVMKRAEDLMRQGKFTSALDQYDSAEAVMPNNPMITLGRANAELGSGFFARADAHIRQALTSDRALLMGQYDLTDMLGEERLTKIVGELKEIANKEPNKPTAVFLLAYIAYNTGHEQQALGYLDLAEKRAPDQASFFKLLKDHWALPDAGKTEGTPPSTDTAKPDLNK